MGTRFSARAFTADDSFLHLVGDHLYIGANRGDPARQLIEIATAENCSVSAVQLTKESLLRYYGSVGGERVSGRPDLYRIQTVIEKPTPTRAEQELSITGVRSAHYRCFFGMHVLTPRIMSVLGRQLDANASPVTLSSALADQARQELCLAVESNARRYDLGVRYGLFKTQLALALRGCDRDEILSQLVELLAEPSAAKSSNPHLQANLKSGRYGLRRIAWPLQHWSRMSVPGTSWTWQGRTIRSLSQSAREASGTERWPWLRSPAARAPGGRMARVW